MRRVEPTWLSTRVGVDQSGSGCPHVLAVDQQLDNLIASESSDVIVLDLKDVIVVDRIAIKFLTRVESPRIQIINRPEYVAWSFSFVRRFVWRGSSWTRHVR